MAALTRRTLLAAAALGAAARALPTLAAPAPLRFTHDAFQVTVSTDGQWKMPTAGLATNVAPAERDAALRSIGQTDALYDFPTSITLIHAGKELILVDMGAGDRFMPTTGKLWNNLKSAGIDTAKITKVIFTHGHPDHLWGALDELDDLALPKAAFYVAGAEWNFWTGANATRGLPADRAGFVTGARRHYAAIKDRVTMVKPGDEIVSGLRVIGTPGHTQGHVSLELAGGDGLIVGGDALSHALISFQHPEWTPAADHVPDEAVATRKMLLDRLAGDRSRLIGYHLPYPGFGLVERKGRAYRFVPAA